MKLLSFLCVAALAASAAASSDEPVALARRAANPQIVFAVSSPAFTPQCLNNQWTMFMSLSIKVTIGGVPNLLPMGEIGLPVIDMAFFLNGKAATTTVPSSFNVKPSTAAGNTWSFGLLDDQPNVGGQIQVGACKQGDAVPTVTASFSSKTNIQGQGLANPKVPALSGIPTIVNNLAAANVAGANAGAAAATNNNNNNNNNNGAAATNNNNNNGAAAANNNNNNAAAAAGTPPNQDGACILTYPNTKDAILSAAGLATPWTITAGCDQTADTPTFIQGTIFDPATGNLFVYNPLVINVGTQPAVKPTAPKLPAGAIVTLHFGTNGDSTTLKDASNGAMLKAANCVNGGGGDKSIFGQFAYCNAVAFFAAVNAAKTLNPPIPALGTDKTGMPCITTRSFALVDQDPSDNVITTYLLTSDNKLAQNTAANQNAIKAAGKSFNVLANGSDNRLVTVLGNLIGCKPYMAPDLANANTPIASLALNEIMAANRQQGPVAKVSPNDPMVVLANGNLDATGAKVVAYRQGVNENTGNAANLGTGKSFCQNLGATAPVAYAAWAKMGLTVGAPSPDAGVGIDMATFLGARFQAAWGLLGCDKLMNMASPIICKDANGKDAGDNPAAKCTTTAGFVLQSTSMGSDDGAGPFAASDIASSTSDAAFVKTSLMAVVSASVVSALFCR